MLTDWIPQGTINWLDKNLLVVIDLKGGSAKGYGRAKSLRKNAIIQNT